MKNLKQIIRTEVFKYLFFGVLTTLVYMIARLFLFEVFKQADLSAVLANAISIIFAFWTNDLYVFNQEREGWAKRFLKFTGARLFTLVLDLMLAIILVDKYPQIIGNFVGGNLSLVNAIETLFAQVLIIVLNYVISKLFVFTGKK
ncbi:GtrA family protein [Streptococcus henryi]|uniref:GtrA family protein n=1 Tax=Streptococcus henryi TaxID=439219 RepID=UPI000369AE0D|nr:GtrA family protein [Streptococcus henryi]